MLAAAAVAGLALVGGLVFATTRSDDDTVPADTPTATLPAEPAPDAEVDPDAEAVVVRSLQEPDHRRRGDTGTRTGSRAGDGHGDRHRSPIQRSAAPSATATSRHGAHRRAHDWLTDHPVEGTVLPVTAPVSVGVWRPARWSRVRAGEFAVTGTDRGPRVGTVHVHGRVPDRSTGLERRRATITGRQVTGASTGATYVIELQPSAPSRTPTAPTEYHHESSRHHGATDMAVDSVMVDGNGTTDSAAAPRSRATCPRSATFRS